MKLEEVIEEVVAKSKIEEDLQDQYLEKQLLIGDDLSKYYFLSLGRQDAYEQILNLLRKVGKE